ncbi:MAG TPA: putative glycoside hydrolase [Spirochaetota bacterium]|nr:putative glycoside hydrolase [Spirochaetota bacterium]HNT10448.1 putative glycoside hydrolase [Spirochaetota bacterium]
MRKTAIVLAAACLIALCGAIAACRGADTRAKPAASNEPRYRGLYISNKYSVNLPFMKRLVERGKPLGVNMLVIDVHPYKILRPRINKEVIDYLKSENLYLVARVVCFQDGLDKLPVPEPYMERLMNVFNTALTYDFPEIQLDYIRFKDGGAPYSLKRKYDYIADLLQSFRTISNARGVKLSADLFGRVMYNKNDPIGQQLELFARYTDVIYPMLYPSHFTGDRQRLSNPGATIKEGTMLGINRLSGTQVRVLPYVQAFGYNIGWARVNLVKYVELQVIAVEETPAGGWVAWNAKGDYESVFRALDNLKAPVASQVETR